eukprot:CAMPEP_0183315790 /NCGR_PEP_ID=MMETSP0160_2-20130417/52884_1 /TAXON_ID=2839 ORGANISM="Odontella Sinensis, Strain Grunow 1884" /NCGR_SAMPLE_ID=MMETSP0160_2 /ASSEMBLY_ACC=CAM_ASM_000250 /LENGTH=43 /DNA_ID= /DNA_START= /DNA_END= /DNA_ORIENTATION=
MAEFGPESVAAQPYAGPPGETHGLLTMPVASRGDIRGLSGASA